MRHPLRHALRAVAALAVLVPAFVPAPAAAQAYPSKPIRMVIGYTPGGFTDTMARLIGDPLGKALGQNVIFENKPGANGMIGGEMVAKAAPDGYTLITVIAAHSANPSLYAKMPFDAVKDFAPVSLIGIAPLILVANKDFPARNAAEMVAYAKANPGKVNYGSSGTGAAAHLSMEAFMSQTGIRMQHVPYKGTAPALTDMMGGQIGLMFDTPSSMMPQVRAGKIKALGMASEKRLPSATEVPTMGEGGGVAFTAGTWAMVLAPAGTPKEIVARLSAEIGRIIRSPAIRERLETLAVDGAGTTPEETLAFLQAEVAKWGKVVKDANVKVDN